MEVLIKGSILEVMASQLISSLNKLGSILLWLEILIKMESLFLKNLILGLMGRSSGFRKSILVITKMRNLKCTFTLFVERFWTAVKPANKMGPKLFNGNSMVKTIRSGFLPSYDLLTLNKNLSIFELLNLNFSIVLI